MTTRENIWLRRDESQSQPCGAVRADAVSEFTIQSDTQCDRFLVVLGGGRSAKLGSCQAKYSAQMASGFFSVMRQAERSAAHSVVIEAVPLQEQTGSEGHFWYVHEDVWPATGLVPETSAGAPRIY